MKYKLTQKRLKELLDYNPDTGVFTWNVDRNGGAYKGDAAGCKKVRSGNDGHKKGTKQEMSTTIDGKRHQLHRLTFLYMTGYWPKDQVDHINRDPWDNRWCNLRDVSGQENSKNQSIHRNNTSGVNGVHWNKTNSKWRAKIDVDGNRVHLGYFKELDAAVAARRSAEKEYGYHPTHGRRKPI